MMRGAQTVDLTQRRKAAKNCFIPFVALFARSRGATAVSVGETADMAGLAARSTAGRSSHAATILTKRSAKNCLLSFASLRLCVSVFLPRGPAGPR